MDTQASFVLQRVVQMAALTVADHWDYLFFLLPWVTPLATAGSKVWTASDVVYVGTTSQQSFSWSVFVW